VSLTAVLDGSAARAFAEGSASVGELLMMVGDDGDTAGLPVVCLVEALTAAKPAGEHSDMLRLLAERTPAVVVLPLVDPWAVAGLARGLPLGAAQAARAAIHHGAQLLTADAAPYLVPGVLPPDLTILEI
jgi:hypothetical protein